MKKFLILPMLFATVLSFASTPTTTPDWVIIINESGTYVFDDGHDCSVSVFVNTDEIQGSGSFSIC